MGLAFINEIIKDVAQSRLELSLHHGTWMVFLLLLPGDLISAGLLFPDEDKKHVERSLPGSAVQSKEVKNNTSTCQQTADGQIQVQLSSA